MDRTTYHHLHPRGFANECNIVRCETDEERADAAAEGFERITRRALAAHIAWVNAENDAWGSGRVFGRIRVADVTSAPEYRFVAG